MLSNHYPWKTFLSTLFWLFIIIAIVLLAVVYGEEHWKKFQNFVNSFAINEQSLEEVIRILWKFNTLGYFKYWKCIIFGRFGVNVTCYDYDLETCLQDSVLGNMNIPVVYDADISHKSPCMPIINGAIATINVKDG